MNADSVSQMITQFSYKNTREHIRSCLKYWKSLAVTAVGMFGILWGIAEASAYFLKADLRGWQFFLAAVVVSIAAALGRVVYVYLNACPSGLENESTEARRVAQVQRPLWEFRLARRLLEDKLGELDSELGDLLEGRILVPVTQHLRITDYADWAQSRIATLRRMADVAQRLLITDFPAAVRSQPGQCAKPTAILAVVNQIRDLYAEAVVFERAHRAVEPPEILANAHTLLQGWTEPIRDGIRQVFGFLF